jgi:SAM-dependent methyltransferase
MSERVNVKYTHNRTNRTHSELRERVCKMLTRLPIGPEQWESTHESIIAENLERLTCIAEAAYAAPLGPALDIGVGYGYSAAAIRAARPDEELWVLEHPSRSIVLSEFWRRMLVVLQCRAVLADAIALPFRSEYFSFVCAAELIEHLPPEKLLTYLTEWLRVLKPKGFLIVTTPNLARLRNRLILLRGKSFLSSPITRIGSTYGHLREYTISEVVELFSTVGLTEIAWSLCCSHRITGYNSLLSKCVALLERFLPKIGFPSLSSFLVVWGRKL